MKMAYTIASGRGDTDLLLAGLAQRLHNQGFRICGTVQVNTECGGGAPCDMEVFVLPDGPNIRISQSLGKGAQGCRLDREALEIAVSMVHKRLSGGADLLIVNKFGKHEAEGRGFRNVIADALTLNVPVLVGLSGLNKDAFEEFSGGMAVELPPDVKSLIAWAEGHPLAA
ncbi:MAG: DUF2478 domain-containing protein [Pseudomonadota bacterium]